MPITRRELVLRSGRLGAAGLMWLAYGTPNAAHAVSNRRAPTGKVARLSPPLRAADYLALADEIADRFEPQWDRRRSSYKQPTRFNSAFLLTYAVAAGAGHDGPCRNDERARLIARRLCETPPWLEATDPGSTGAHYHRPGWGPNMYTNFGSQHISVDPKVAEALAYAWQQRDVLQLPQDTRDLIQDRVARCARSSFYRFPSVRLNQINWPCELYAHCWTITGDPELLIDDYRAHVERFIAGIKRPLEIGGSANLGPNYSFRYLPISPPRAAANLDTPEYANLVCDFLIHYDRALVAGMSPFADDHLALMRAWVERILFGYWTHAGYLNWDTGLGVRRWHWGQYWAFAMQGLLAIIAAPRFHARPEYGQWAKYIFDRGLLLHHRLAAEAGGAAPKLLFGERPPPGMSGDADLFAIRMQSSAAQAAALGLGELESEKPPPLFSFDPDTGRLAITTPAYSTGILPHNRRATPYAGVEPARLFDQDQRVLSNPGGRPPACFAAVVKDRRDRTVLLSQPGNGGPHPDHTSLRLAEWDARAVKRPLAYPRHPYAGPFKRLTTEGMVASRHVKIHTRHRFGSSAIELRWTIEKQRRQHLTVDLYFPSWGSGAEVIAVRGGRRLVLAAPNRASSDLQLGDAAYFFYLSGKEGGYVVVPRTGFHGALAHILQAPARAGARDPGPTLAIRLGARGPWETVQASVHIAIARSHREALAQASALRSS
jgi:hypothetical protein